MTDLRRRTASVLALLVGLVLLVGPGSPTSPAAGAEAVSGQPSGGLAALGSTAGRDVLRPLADHTPPAALGARQVGAVAAATLVLPALLAWGPVTARRRGPGTAAVRSIRWVRAPPVA